VCETWKKSPTFAAAMTQLFPVMPSRPISYFVKFVPYAPKEVISSPIVELLTYTDCTNDEDEMRAMVEKAKNAAGCNGVASGYSTGADSVSKTFVAIIGWNSVDESNAADKTAYRGNSLLEAHHVNFNFPIKGFRGL